MLASLIDHRIYVSNVYMYNIDYMICEIHHLHLEQYFIQQKHDINLRHYVSITLSLL